MYDFIKKVVGNAWFKYSCYLLFILLLCFGSYYFGKKSAVCNTDTTGVSKVDEELGRAINNQQETSRVTKLLYGRIESVREGIGKLEESVGRTEQFNKELVGEEQRAGELIRECQQILEGARNSSKQREEEINQSKK